MIRIKTLFDKLAAEYCGVEVIKGHLDYRSEWYPIVFLIVFLFFKVVNVGFIPLLTPVVLSDHLIIPSVEDVFNFEFGLALVFILGIDFALFKGA